MCRFLLQQMGLEFMKAFQCFKNSLSVFSSVLIWEIMFIGVTFISLSAMYHTAMETLGNISKHPFWNALLPHNVADGAFLPGKRKALAGLFSGVFRAGWGAYYLPSLVLASWALFPLNGSLLLLESLRYLSVLWINLNNSKLSHPSSASVNTGSLWWAFGSEQNVHCHHPPFSWVKWQHLSPVCTWVQDQQWSVTSFLI